MGTPFQKAKGSGAKDGLLGFTGSTAAVRFGSIIYRTASAVRRHSPRLTTLFSIRSGWTG